MTSASDEGFKQGACGPDTYYICSTTHWDREWHGTYQMFRMRLVRMLDELLHVLEYEPEFRCFNFDGQTIVLEDYLEIRPHKEPIVRRLIEEGRLVVGPWYILSDEFLVSGESVIRNLMFGARAGKRFGRLSNVGYLPDTFGHFSQMPQLLKQWGIDVAIAWRGLSGEEYKNELVWRSPDGSSVLLSHLTEERGYFNASLYADFASPEQSAELIKRGMHPYDVVSGDDAVDFIVDACSFVKSRAATNCHLLLNGFDHMSVNPEIPEIVRNANLKLENGRIAHASLDEYAQALALVASGKDLRFVEGELRDTVRTKTGWGYILNGVLSSRIYLKQQNQECCTLLESWVEPFSSFNSLIGGVSQKGFVDKAWQWVLENHPHDSIGGCSTDEVHDQMETRFVWAKDIGDSLLDYTFADILGNVKLDDLADGEYAIAVFNPNPEIRSDWLQAEIEIPWIAAKSFDGSKIRGVNVTDMSGKEQPCRLIKYEPRRIVNRAPLHPPVAVFFERPVFTISLWAENIPACGYKVFRLRPLVKPANLQAGASAEPNVLENDCLRAEIMSNGSITLTVKSTGFIYENLHYFEDGGDNGDEYTYSFPKDDSVYTTLTSNAEVALVEDSDARIAYKVVLTMDLPDCMDQSKQARSAATKPLTIESVISLGTGSKRLDIRTVVVNTVKDHRLRVMFPSYLDASVSSAEAQFDVVDHPVHIEQPSLDVWKEDQPRQFSQKSFVSVTDGAKGLTVANRGLPEYEVTDDAQRAVAITLLRAVGYLSVGWCNTRSTLTGPFIETPDAQILGRRLVFDYSIIPHQGSWQGSAVQKEAHAFARGMKAFPVHCNNGLDATLPDQFSFLSIDSDNAVLSSVKQCEDEDGFIIRLWNGSGVSSTGNLTLFRCPRGIYLSNLREERCEEIHPNSQIELEIGAKKIKTLRVEM